MFQRLRKIDAKQQFSQISSNIDYDGMSSSINTRKTQLVESVNKNKKSIGIAILVTFCILFYLIVIFRRVPRFLSRMNKEYTHACKITSLRFNKKVMKGNYKLKDFFIACSYKSYLPCTNYLDYACIDAIKRTLFFGSRYIDLDIMMAAFNCTNLVICNGRARGNWHTTTSIDFEQTIKFIAIYAFGSEVPNNSDPLFINLNFKTWYDRDAYDLCAKILVKHFSHKLLPIEYSYQGRESRVNICEAPIKSLFDKVVIMCNNDVKNTEMDELVNMGSYEYGNIRNVTYKDVVNCKDIKEFREFNKTYMTRVIPSFTGRMKKNYNFLLPYYLGCQFICMNYTEPDQWMKAYVNKFSEHSFILKPYKLRHKIDNVSRPFMNSY